MPLPFITDVAEFRLHWVSASRLDAINVLHYAKADNTAWDLTDLGTVIGLIVAAWDVSLAPAVSDEVFLADVTGTALNAADGAQLRTVSNDPGEQAAGQLLPFQVSACMRLTTGVRGKAGRGRIFLTGFCEEDSNGASVGAAVLAAVDGFGAALIADPEPDYDLVVVSYFEGGAPRVTPLVNKVVTAGCDLNWKTQRRRALAG